MERFEIKVRDMVVKFGDRTLSLLRSTSCKLCEVHDFSYSKIHRQALHILG